MLYLMYSICLELLSDGRGGGREIGKRDERGKEQRGKGRGRGRRGRGRGRGRGSEQTIIINNTF